MTTEEARKRLQACKGHYPEIARDSGRSYSWVLKFADGTIKDPGNDCIESLAKSARFMAAKVKEGRKRA